MSFENYSIMPTYISPNVLISFIKAQGIESGEQIITELKPWSPDKSLAPSVNIQNSNFHFWFLSRFRNQLFFFCSLIYFSIPMGFDYSIYQLPSLRWVKTGNTILPDDLFFEFQSIVFAVYSTFSFIKLF